MADTVVHFTTLEAMQQKVAKLAADNKLEFDVNDTAVLTRRLDQAFHIIETVLIARGLSAVQISTWSRGEEFQLDIATFWYGKDSGWGGKLIEEKDWLKVFNRETELIVVPVVSNDGVLLVGGVGEAVAVGMDLMAINQGLGITH